jgi:hypothetical protein
MPSRLATKGCGVGDVRFRASFSWSSKTAFGPVPAAASGASHPLPTTRHHCIDASAERSHHSCVRMLAHIKKLDDCFGQFLVRVSCPCGASRHIEPEALARLVGWTTTLKALAPRLRCSQCGKKAAEVVAVAKPRPRGIPKNPH